MDISKIHALAAEMEPRTRGMWIASAVDLAKERCIGVLKADDLDVETEMFARGVLDKLRDLKP